MIELINQRGDRRERMLHEEAFWIFRLNAHIPSDLNYIKISFFVFYIFMVLWYSILICVFILFIAGFDHDIHLCAVAVLVY